MWMVLSCVIPSSIIPLRRQHYLVKASVLALVELSTLVEWPSLRVQAVSDVLICYIERITFI